MNVMKNSLNILRNYIKYNIWADKIYFPHTIYLEVTNFCNAECIMCPNKSIQRKKGYMSWDLFKKLVDECFSFEKKVEKLTFFLHKDGEPLLDPLLFDRIAYIKNKLKNSKVGINSNAALLTEEKAWKLIDSGIDQITFSVDGTTPASYEKIRRGLKYSTVESNINRFYEIKEKQNIYIYTMLQMVVDKNNENEIEDFKTKWKNKADLVYIKPMHNFLDMNTSIKTKSLSNKQLYKCQQPFDYMLIYWNGDVGLCCWDYDNFAKLGNVQSDNILKIYNNKNYMKIRDAMEKMDCIDITPCNRCSQIYGEDMKMQL